MYTQLHTTLTNLLFGASVVLSVFDLHSIFFFYPLYFGKYLFTIQRLILNNLLTMFLRRFLRQTGLLGKDKFPLFTCVGNHRFYSKEMAIPSVYITRQINKEALDILKDICDVSIWTEPGPVPRQELLKNIKDKSALFCMLTDKIDSEVLDNAGNNLKIVATMSVGYDHFDVNEIKKRGIKMAYTPDILTDATAELAVALLLATSRRLLEANEEAKIGGWKAWSPFWMCGPGLKGSTVGIVGFGRIGQEIAKRLKPFGPAKILYFNRSEKPEAGEIGAIRVSFDELLAQSDFISVSCSLTPDTKEMFNDAAFKKMKKSAVFVNTSRGGVVDQEALIRALENETIWGAGLDVMTPEPLPLDNPLFRLKNCVILPHIGSACVETRNDMAILTAKNIIAALKNEPLLTELYV